eukprot:SAG31_NODE_3307_length_4437_cov_10.156754_4_plen_52_part_00
MLLRDAYYCAKEPLKVLREQPVRDVTPSRHSFGSPTAERLLADADRFHRQT